jgi:hypothetical protein
MTTNTAERHQADHDDSPERETLLQEAGEQLVKIWHESDDQKSGTGPQSVIVAIKHWVVENRLSALIGRNSDALGLEPPKRNEIKVVYSAHHSRHEVGVIFLDIEQVRLLLAPNPCELEETLTRLFSEDPVTISLNYLHHSSDDDIFQNIIVVRKPPAKSIVKQLPKNNTLNRDGTKDLNLSDLLTILDQSGGRSLWPRRSPTVKTPPYPPRVWGFTATAFVLIITIIILSFFGGSRQLLLGLGLIVCVAVSMAISRADEYDRTHQSSC